MEWTNWITAFFALYGAILSTHNLISSRRDKRRRVKVEFSMGLWGGAPETTMLFLEVSNPGHIAATIQPPGIQLPKRGGTIVFPDPRSDVQFPHDLLPGKKCTVMVPLEKLKNQLKEKGFSGKVNLVGFCKDVVGTIHKGKSLKLDLG